MGIIIHVHQGVGTSLAGVDVGREAASGTVERRRGLPSRGRSPPMLVFCRLC